MEHVVFFPAHDGSPAFRRLASLEEAVRLVEHLRNEEGVDNVTVHSLAEVPLEFKAYYRVALPPAEPVRLAGDAEEVASEGEVAPGGAVPVGLVPEQAPEPAPEPAPVSLGFFAG